MAIGQSKEEASLRERQLLEEATLRSIAGLAAVTVSVVLFKYSHGQQWLIDARLAAGCTQPPSGAMALMPPGV